jgi:hypothetical protein
MTVTKAASAPRARPGKDDPITRLSFVADRDGKALQKPTGRQFPRCFWHVKSTGDFTADDLMGERLALEYLAYEEANKGTVCLLPWIVADMPRKLGPIEISFFTTVGYAAKAGAQRAREVVAYWERRRKEAAL